LLGVSEIERYSSFKYLNDEVLKRSIKEINATSDITVTQEVRKEGRNVVAVKFHITEQEPKGEERPGTGTLVALMTGDRTHEHMQAILGRLMAFGVTRRQAEDVLQKRGEDYINEVLDVVEAAFERGKVTNLTAFTAAALRDDYRPKRPCYEETKEKERQQAIAAREAARVQELERQRTAAREERERLLQALDQLCSDERETLEREFSAVLARENDILTYFLERDGISKNPLIRAAFETFARKHLFGDSSPIPQPG
jgi:hypothetical protein